MPFIVAALILGFAVFLFVLAYNKLVRFRNEVKNSWSQIDVQLKRRHDLIPNLVETAKGYLKHERETLENVIRARQMAVDARSAADAIKAENQLSQTLRSLFAVAENYPDLKANQNMLAIQEELSSTENKIAFARQHYNDSVMKYNTQLETIPTNFIAGVCNFAKEPFFEVESAEERKAPKVQF